MASQLFNMCQAGVPNIRKWKTFLICYILFDMLVGRHMTGFGDHNYEKGHHIHSPLSTRAFLIHAPNLIPT